MADENEVTNENEALDSDQEQQDQPGQAEPGQAKKSRFDTAGLLAWALIALLVAALSAGGGVAAGIVTRSSAAEEQSPTPADSAGQEDISDDAAPSDPHIGKDFAYYEFDPLTVNLNVVRQNRYIKVTLVLAIPKEDQVEITKRLDDKKVELKNWIMTYMAGHTLEQVAGRKNMIRIQREICDTLNEKLWPNQRPRINHVLFKDYAVQ